MPQDVHLRLESRVAALADSSPGPAETGLSREAFSQIRKALHFKPSGAWTFGVVLFDCCLLVGVGALLRSGHWLAFLASQCLLCIVFFNSFALMHECGHGSASRYRIVNTITGHWASLFCFIPYFPWKYIHQQHHTWTGNVNRDPVLQSLRRWRDTGVPRIARIGWWSWIPIGALLQHVVYLSYPLRMWRNGEMSAVKLWRSLASLVVLPLGYACMYQAVPDLMRLSNVALAILFYLVTEELVNIPHHSDVSIFEGKLPAWSQYRATRSCYYPFGLSEVLFLNFNFHTEHHLFPSLPWHRLRGARALVKGALGAQYQEAIGISWNIENRRRGLQSIVDRYSAS